DSSAAAIAGAPSTPILFPASNTTERMESTPFQPQHPRPRGKCTVELQPSQHALPRTERAPNRPGSSQANLVVCKQTRTGRRVRSHNQHPFQFDSVDPSLTHRGESTEPARTLVTPVQLQSS